MTAGSVSPAIEAAGGATAAADCVVAAEVITLSGAAAWLLGQNTLSLYTGFLYWSFVLSECDRIQFRLFRIEFISKLLFLTSM